jgi:alpha-methylacyl-CoA racemase
MDLSDIQILDLTRLLPGNYATQLLAEMGAEVLKVEEPGRGDYSRHLDPTTAEGVGARFSALNRGKKSITIDLKSADGTEILYQLAAEADVCIENFRPGTAERLGVDYESIREQNPDIVYCSLTGYGQQGPYSDQPGHDINYAGLTGLLDMSRGDKAEQPSTPGFPIIDHASGLFCTLCILGQLLTDTIGEKTGNDIDISMTDVGYSFSLVGTVRAMCGQTPRPGETMLTGKFPSYGIYETSDGRYLTIAALETQFWTELCHVLGREELVECHRSDDPAVRAALSEELTAAFRTKPRQEWVETFQGTDVPFGVVNTPAEALSDPYIVGRDLVSDGPDGRDVPHVPFPATVSDGMEENPVDWPELGEHTDLILADLNYSERERERLRERQVI